MLTAVTDTAQRYGRNTEVRGDIMLRNTFKYIGMMRDKIVVALFRAVFDPRDKEVLVGQEPVKDMVFDFSPDGRRLFGDELVILFGKYIEQGGFDGFDTKEAGLTGTEAFYSRHTLTFKKELCGNIAPFIVEANPQAPLQYKKGSFRNIAFLQQYRFGRHFEPFKKVDILMPFVRWKNRAFVHDRLCVSRRYKH